MAHITDCRASFHRQLTASGQLVIDQQGVPSNADKDNKLSVRIADSIAKQLNAVPGTRMSAQSSGSNFESVCVAYLRASFGSLHEVRPGKWQFLESSKLKVSQFQQYEHLDALSKLASDSPALAASLGNDYTILPDVVIARELHSDAEINKNREIVDGRSALESSLREGNGRAPILHASISCKWTLRSDRAQNARAEALNLVRNRKGRLPHIAVVTGEPLPSRLASLALGTGDIDCVYHFALYELIDAVKAVEAEDAMEMLEIMVGGRRLKDISDLPLDLAV